MRTLISFFLALSAVAVFADAGQTADNRQPTTDNAARSAVIQHFILKPDHVLSQADMSELAARGIQVQRVLSGARYIVRADSANAVASEGHAEHFGAAHKIAASAYHAASRGTAFTTVRLLFHDDVSFADAQAAVENAGGAVERVLATDFDPPRALTVRIPSTAVTQLANDERVFGIYGPPHRIKAQNAVAAQLSHVTPLFSAPYNLSGAGVVISEFELAPADTAHPEFGGRFTSHVTGSVGGDSGHPTHVAGTMIAQGIDPRAKGMAPAALLHEFSAQEDIGVVLSNKQNMLPSLSIVADNNSWGYVLGWCSPAECGGNFESWNGADELFGGYDALDSAPYDAMARQTPVLFVHSAGNDGGEGQFPVSGPWFQHLHSDNNGVVLKNEIFCYSQDGSGSDCPTGTCTAGRSSATNEPHCETAKHPTYGPFVTMGLLSTVKNVIAVGAVTPSTNIAGFSSRGPTRDGRVKPDIVAKGTIQYSTIPGASYTVMQGTSMSSPVITGISAIFTEQWRKTFNGQTPTPQQLKTLFIAGADDLGNPGPDYTYGFGLANAQASVDLIIADGGTGSRIKTADIAQGQQTDATMVVGATQNVRVVLGWVDPEILPPADQADEKTLINDLDLKVIDPSGNTVLPYVLDKNNPTANATHGENHVDNVEELEIRNAVPGTYHVIVSGTTIASGPLQRYVLISNAPFAAAVACTDPNEPNDTPAQATPLANGTARSGRLCSQDDVDYFGFTAITPSTVTASVATTDTPVTVTLLSNGQALASKTIAAGATDSVAFTFPQIVAAPGTNALTLRIEPAGTVGSNAAYTVTASFSPSVPGRRRTSRR